MATERGADFWDRVGANGRGSAGDASVQSLLAGQLDGQNWLTGRLAQREAESRIPRALRYFDPEFRDWRELWPAMAEGRFDRIALVPTRPHWLVPGLLSWTGAVNADIGGVEHAAILRRWAGRWRTELVAMEGESMMLLLDVPPVVTQALTAAFEAHLYCRDAVDQEAGTVDKLAAWPARCGVSGGTDRPTSSSLPTWTRRRRR